MAELVVEDYCKNQNKDFTMFRFYNVTGADGLPPTNPDGLFASLIAAIDKNKFTILGDDYSTEDGTCIRDYTHVNEICHAVIRGISKSTGKIENLGHGQGHTVNEIVEIFKTVNKVDFKVEYGPRRSGDIEISVLSNVSKFIKHHYTFNELLRYK
jgi:UDP-glucose 4-epimerase